MDLRLLVLLALAGGFVRLAVAEPTLAAAIVLGLSVLVILHNLIK